MSEDKKQDVNSGENAAAKKVCGIIMPIAETNGYANGHWKDVYNILCEAIDTTNFTPQLVSDDDAIGLIHSRIVNNVYSNEIVICDVSSKNPNVMFELGMRLAFDKPTIIIKDERTDYSFDTGVIEHIQYPSSLRFAQIVTFKLELAKRIKATYNKAQNPDYSPFLKYFGKTISPASLQQTEISEGKFILDELILLRKEISLLKRSQELINNNIAIEEELVNTINSEKCEYNDLHTYIIKEHQPSFRVNLKKKK